MYEELVKALRRCATRYVLAYEERKDVMLKAADAIEGLEEERNEVAGAICKLPEELETIVESYRNRMAYVPTPPKEE